MVDRKGLNLMKSERYDFGVRKDLGGKTLLILSDDLLTDVRIGLSSVMNEDEFHKASFPEEMSDPRDQALYALWQAIHQIQRL